jgi:hypothetical protein
MEFELERDMWKQRVKNLLKLWRETERRIEDVNYSRSDISAFIDDSIMSNKWIRELEQFPNLPRLRIDEIDESLEGSIKL